jgi:hypothetical protein
MRARILRHGFSLREIMPCLWGFAAAAALDYVIDVKILFLPAMAGAAAFGIASLLLRRPGR